MIRVLGVLTAFGVILLACGSGGGDGGDNGVNAVGNVAQVSASSFDTCAVVDSGGIWCWGYNRNGQLGGGGRYDSIFPVMVVGINNAVAVSAGRGHTCALLTGKDVMCWGGNESGQLGDGTGGGRDALSKTPVAVSGLGDVMQIAAGASHTCALLENRSVMCWGGNESGQLGNRNTNDGLEPQMVSRVASAVQVAAGNTHSCAVLADGRVRCWGSNVYGRLGNGSEIDTNIPAFVSDLNTAAQVSAGWDHTCAVLKDGSVSCWGDNDKGELGTGDINATDGTEDAKSLLPVKVQGIDNAVAVSAGRDHSCALLDDNSIMCWGANLFGQLGDGTGGTDGDKSLLPVKVQGIDNAVQISAGWDHSCALLDTALINCWGANGDGQLGDTTGRYSNVPVFVIPL